MDGNTPSPAAHVKLCVQPFTTKYAGQDRTAYLIRDLTLYPTEEMANAVCEAANAKLATPSQSTAKQDGWVGIEVAKTWPDRTRAVQRYRSRSCAWSYSFETVCRDDSFTQHCEYLTDDCKGEVEFLRLDTIGGTGV